MKKNFNRILSLVLVLMMVLSLAPVSALAEADVEELAAEAAPIEEVAPVEELVGEVPAPVVEELVSEEPAPVVEEVVSEEPAPVVEEVVSEEPAPVVEEVVSEEPAPVVEEVVSEEPAPVVEEVVSEEPAPVEEETAPVEEEPAAVEESDEEAGALADDEYPMQSFNYRADAGTEITVDAPEGAFPEDTQMVVTEMNLAEVQKLVDADAAVDGNVIAAADISFYHNGEKIQPKVPVYVSYASAAAAQAVDPQVVHISDAAAVEVIENVESAVTFAAEPMQMMAMSGLGSAEAPAASNEMVKLSFAANSFSVYAIIGTVVIEEDEGSFDFETDDYVITVSYTKEAQIPHGTKLVVSEIPFGSEEYNELNAKTFDKLNENALCRDELAPDMRKGIASAAFFNISLIGEDGEFEPAVPLQVNIHLKHGGLIQFNDEESKIIHFGDKGTEIIDGEALQVGVTGEPLFEGMPGGSFANDFTYMQDGFSVVGIFTTDEYASAGSVFYGVPSLKAATRDGEPSVIDADKTVTDDDKDGIYDLKLSVVGNSQQSDETTISKSNVVIMIDTSGSMDEEVYTPYTYSDSTYSTSNRYYTEADNWGRRTRIYHDSEGWYYETGGYWSERVDYTGTVYWRTDRTGATKAAANELVSALLEANNNDKNIKDMVEISLMNFANSSNLRVSRSTSLSELQTSINGLGHNGGTNWEAAMQGVRTEAAKYKNDSADDPNVTETTYVIFMTDGMPTFYGSGPSGTGRETTDNVRTCWTQARDDARNVVTDGNILYNIFAFGDGSDYLKALTNYAYGRNGSYDDTTDTDYVKNYFFDAKDGEALQNAFNTIIDSISKNQGFGGVALTDGVSLGATNTSATIGGTVNSDTFNYTVFDGARILYSVKFHGDEATFTINGTDYSATCEDVTVEMKDKDGNSILDKDGNPIVINSKVASVTVGDTVYKMSPATMDDKGLLEWELAGLGVLGNYRYVLSMSVWPNQTGYDIAADLNNGIYTTVDEALDAYGVTNPTKRQQIKDSVIKQSDGSYAVYTNYEQSVRYHEADEETTDEGTNTYYGQQQTTDLPQPSPIPLKGSSLNLRKAWEADLAQSELEELLWNKDGTPTKYGVTLHVWKADTEDTLNTLVENNDTSKQYKQYPLGWDETEQKYIWEKAMGVAPGMMLSLSKAQSLGLPTNKQVTYKGATYCIIEDGHYYYVTEDKGDLHFELSTEVYHPMIVDGTLYDVTFSGTTVEDMVPMSEVLATNTLKGGIDVYKKVYKEDMTTEITDCTDEFAFKVTLWKEDENGAKTAVFTPDDEMRDDHTDSLSGALGFRVYEGTGDNRVTKQRHSISNWTNTVSNPNYPDNKAVVEVGAQSTTITITMQANQYFFIVNVPAGTMYTVEELQGGTYNHFKTELKEAEDGEVVKSVTVSGDELAVQDHTMSDQVHGNTAEYITFSNWAANFYVYHSSDNTVEKISFADPRVVGTVENGTYKYSFNIANETKANTLYGGYYKSYKGQKLTDAQIVAGTYTNGDSGSYTYYSDHPKTGNWLTDTTGAEAYTYAYVNEQSRNVWGSDYYTADGRTMNPASNTVYYLKEVPNYYLLPYSQYTYGTGDKVIHNMWFISALDDLNYVSGKVGFVVIQDNKFSTIVDTLTVKTANGAATVTLSPKSLFGNKGGAGAGVQAGYLGYWDASSMIAANTKVTLIPFWTTMDGVKVSSTTSREINFNNGKVGSGGMRLADTVVGSTLADKP